MIQPVFRPKQPEYGLYLYLELYYLLYNANAKQIVQLKEQHFLRADPVNRAAKTGQGTAFSV